MSSIFDKPSKMIGFLAATVALASIPYAYTSSANAQEPINAPSELPEPTEPRLVHIGDIRFNIGETNLGGQTPRGTFIYVPINGGYFETVYPLPEGFGIQSNATEGLKAEVLTGGSDYPHVYENKLTEINVQVAAKGINNPHLFHISSYGLCEWNPLVFSMMLGQDDARSTQFGEVNTWQVFRINTDSPEFFWLNFALIVGQEKLMYEEGRLAATRMKLYQFLVR